MYKRQVYAEVYNRKVIIHTRSTDIEYYGKLQELSDMAGTDFFRTHRALSLIHILKKYTSTCFCVIIGGREIFLFYEFDKTGFYSGE